MPRANWSRLAPSFAALTLALTCSACGALRTTADPPPKPDAALLQQPRSLPQPRDSTAPSLIENHVQVAAQYHALANQTKALIEVVDPPKNDEPRWWQFWRIYL